MIVKLQIIVVTYPTIDSCPTLIVNQLSSMPFIEPIVALLLHICVNLKNDAIPRCVAAKLSMSFVTSNSSFTSWVIKIIIIL